MSWEKLKHRKYWIGKTKEEWPWAVYYEGTKGWVHEDRETYNRAKGPCTIEADGNKTFSFRGENTHGFREMDSL